MPEPHGPERGAVNAANLITLAGAGFGLAAVALTAAGHHPSALTALMAAVLCDRLDGIVARRMGLSSDFGRELDSLADAVSFLMAPASIVAVLSGGQALVCAAAGVFVLAGLWRLARFNIEGMEPGAVFSGLPTTIAGAWFILAWAALRLSPLAAHAPPLLAGLLLVTAPLMLSSVPVRKDGLIVKGLQLLLLPTLIAAWWGA